MSDCLLLFVVIADFSTYGFAGTYSVRFVGRQGIRRSGRVL